MLYIKFNHSKNIKIGWDTVRVLSSNTNRNFPWDVFADLLMTSALMQRRRWRSKVHKLRVPNITLQCYNANIWKTQIHKYNSKKYSSCSKHNVTMLLMCYNTNIWRKKQIHKYNFYSSRSKCNANISNLLVVGLIGHRNQPVNHCSKHR